MARSVVRTPARLRHVVIELLTRPAIAPLLPLTSFLIAAAPGGLVRNDFPFGATPLKPKLARISPLAGLKRLLSLRLLAAFARNALKSAGVGALGTTTL